ncbi:hypothetical protein STPH2_1027 [Streptomyces sp. KO7888]|nr:hypothetical protein [Streptomyces sp. KO7888]
MGGSAGARPAGARASAGEWPIGAGAGSGRKSAVGCPVRGRGVAVGAGRALGSGRSVRGPAVVESRRSAVRSGVEESLIGARGSGEVCPALWGQGAVESHRLPGPRRRGAADQGRVSAGEPSGRCRGGGRREAARRVPGWKPGSGRAEPCR